MFATNALAHNDFNNAARHTFAVDHCIP